MSGSGGRKELDRALTVAEAADLVGGALRGDPAVVVRDVAPIFQAGPEELGFLADRRYARFVAETRAGALLVAESLAADVPEGEGATVVVAEPHVALARLLSHFHPEPTHTPSIHPTAVIGRGVRLGDGVTVGPYAVIESDAAIGDRVVIGAHAVVGAGCVVGDDARLFPHVVLYEGSVIGRRVILHAGVRIGVDGFGYVFQDGEHRKVPQVGGCEVGDDVEVGANCCVDRGSIGRTEVGRGTKIDNLVHVGHNVRVGSNVLLVAQVGIAGSTRVGDGAVLGGQAGLVGHLEIEAGAQIAAQAGVIGDVRAGEPVMGFPARPRSEFLRATSQMFRLPRLVGRVRALEQAVAGLTGAEAGSEPERE